MGKHSKILCIVPLLLVVFSCAKPVEYDYGTDWEKSVISSELIHYMEELKKIDGLPEDERLVKTALIDAEMRNKGLYKPFGVQENKQSTKYINLSKYDFDCKDIIYFNDYIPNDVRENALKLDTREKIIEYCKTQGLVVQDSIKRPGIFIYSRKNNRFNYIGYYKDEHDFFKTTNRQLIDITNKNEYIYDLAESITTNDNQTIRIKIKDAYFYNNEGDQQRKIASGDFIYYFNNHCYDDAYKRYTAREINDTEFEITFDSKKTNYLLEIYSYFNYPYAQENRMDGIETVLYSDDSYAVSIEGNDLVLKARKDNIPKEIRYVEEDYDNIKSYLDGPENTKYVYATTYSFLAFNDNTSFYYERDDFFQDNINFRNAILSSFDREYYYEITGANECKTKKDRGDSVVFSPSDKLFSDSFSLKSDFSYKGVTYKAGKTYNEIVAENVVIKDGVDNAKDYYKKAKEEIGSYYLKDKKEYKYDVYHSFTISDDVQKNKYDKISSLIDEVTNGDIHYTYNLIYQYDLSPLTLVYTICNDYSLLSDNYLDDDYLSTLKNTLMKAYISI